MQQSKVQPSSYLNTVPASAWVARYLPLVRQNGHILDLAAGRGRHGRLALKLGHTVTFLDRDISGLRDLADDPRAELVLADLENVDPFPLADSHFDGVIVTNYLYRPLMRKLPMLLRPEGTLIYETFAAGNEAYGRPRNPNFLLQPNELLRIFQPSLQIVAYEHGYFAEPNPRVSQRIAGLRLFRRDLPRRD